MYAFISFINERTNHIIIYAGFLFLDVKLSLVDDTQVSPEIVNTTLFGLSDYKEGCWAIFPLLINGSNV